MRLCELPRVGSRALADHVQAARQRGIDVLELVPYPVRTLPSHVIAAAERAIAENQEAPSQGLPRLRRAVARRLGMEIGREINPDTEVLVTSGAMQGLSIVFRALLEPGDEVVIPSPCYFFHGCIELAGGVAVHVPMAEETGFAWDMEAIAAAITPRTRAIVVNTPVNPTGYVLTRAEIAALADLALAHDLLIIADESYDRMVYDGYQHESVAAIPEAAACPLCLATLACRPGQAGQAGGQARERTILIRSCTKSYAMPAWRVGYIVAPADLTAQFTKAMEWELLHVNHVAQAAAAAAIDGPQDWLEDVAEEFQRARDWLLSGLAKVDGFSCVRPRGGPFLFLNIARLFASSEAASDALLAVGVPTVPGRYCQSDAHVRLAFGATSDVLDRVIARLAEVARRCYHLQDRR
jgi:aminotransferase